MHADVVCTRGKFPFSLSLPFSNRQSIFLSHRQSSIHSAITQSIVAFHRLPTQPLPPSLSNLAFQVHTSCASLIGNHHCRIIKQKQERFIFLTSSNAFTHSQFHSIPKVHFYYSLQRSKTAYFLCALYVAHSPPLVHQRQASHQRSCPLFLVHLISVQCFVCMNGNKGLRLYQTWPCKDHAFWTVKNNLH